MQKELKSFRHSAQKGEGEDLQEKGEEKKSIKLSKNNCLILVLVGILLLVIVWPVEDRESTLQKTPSSLENLTSTGSVLGEPVSTQAGETENGTESAGMRVYADYMEKALEELLTTVEGAGRVKVMLTLESSEEAVVEKDQSTVRAGTTEVDSAGGSRNTTDISSSEETLYISNQGSGGVPYVKKIMAPQIAGVVVSAQGADKEMVARNITEAIEVLFGIDAHKIKIVKMISK